MIEVQGITKTFGANRVLNDVSFVAANGAVTGFLGPNGAGKSTTMRVLLGLITPDHGTALIDGVPYTRQASPMSSVGAVLDAKCAPRNRSAYAYLCALAYTNNIARGRVDEVMDLTGLASVKKTKAGKFSLGMSQRLAIAAALLGDPKNLVLDEPVNGLDPQGIIEVRELILKLNREFGITVLISSHILGELSKLATHYGFIDGGRMVKEISAEALEAACRKCARLTVSDVRALARVLDRLGLEYQIISETQADVFGTVNVTQLTLALAEENCEVTTMQERDESLESYYVNLVGGERGE